MNKEYVGEGYGNTADGMNDGKAPAVSRHALTTNSAIAGISTVDPVRDHKLKFLMQKIDEPFTFFGETKSRKLLTSVVNVLRLVRIQYWFEMFFLQEEQAKKYRGLGKKGLREIKETFAKQNIPFDMKKGYITMLPLRNKVYRSDEKCCDIQMFVNSDAWKNFCALLAPNVAKYSITIGDFTEEYGRFHSYRMNSDNQKLYLPGTTDNQLSDARCDMDDLIKKHYISRMEVFVQKVPLE